VKKVLIVVLALGFAIYLFGFDTVLVKAQTISQTNSKDNPKANPINSNAQESPKESVTHSDA
jgi:hypothetical protein